MTSVARKLLQLAGECGVRRLPRLAAYGLSELYHERRLGVRTMGYIDRRQLGLTSPESVLYAPSAYRDLGRLMRLLAVRAGEDVFLDYGCGMGRAVIVAAMRPFRRVIGVELSPVLVAAARRNVQSMRRPLACSCVEIVAADAAQYQVPTDVTVAYLYNPFTGSLLLAALDNLLRSFRARPRRLRVAFKNPPARLLEDRAPWLAPCERFECLTGHQCVIYRAGG